MAAPKGNKYAQEWTLENAKPRFIDALEYAETSDECLCLQDAISKTGIPYSTFYQLCKDQEDLDLIKQDIQQVIIRRINKGALTNKYQQASSIWRMKQSGEKDQQYLEQKNTGNMMKQEINVISEEAKKALEDLKNKFDDE